jgi:hypothetical protein
MLKMLVVAGDAVDFDKFTQFLSIVLDELSLMRTTMFLAEVDRGKTILDYVVDNSLIFDDIIQTTRKTTRLFSRGDFSLIDGFFTENRIEDIVAEYNSISFPFQHQNHLPKIQIIYIIVAVVFLILATYLLIKKIWFGN